MAHIKYNITYHQVPQNMDKSCDESDKNKHDNLRFFPGLKFAMDNIWKTVFFWSFLCYVICQWSHFNAPHTHLTLSFF